MWLRILIIVLAVLIILIIAFFVIFSDSKLIYWYLTSKKKFKYKMLRKYTKDNQSLLFLGSLHDMHFGFKEYHFLHLKAVLKNYMPDVLLVECRQEEIEVGNFADGPVEMYYLSMIAREMQIPVIGVDWFDHTLQKPGTTITKRDEQILKRIEAAAQSYKKPMVVIGATHLLIEEKMLRKKGYKREKISKEQIDSYYETKESSLKFHKDTVMYIRKRIEREELFLESNDLDEHWINASKRTIKNLNRYIDMIEEGKILLDD